MFTLSSFVMIHGPVLRLVFGYCSRPLESRTQSQACAAEPGNNKRTHGRRAAGRQALNLLKRRTARGRHQIPQMRWQAR